MFDPSAFMLFLAASFALLIVPGPAVIYIVARSIDQGRWAGIVSVLGIAFGTIFHIFAAALGISALLMTSVVAFNALKILGVIYLIYLGIRTLLTKEIPVNQHSEKKRLSRIFYEGMWVNILNPKTALFFFAFLPQFVDASAGSVPLQILVLGMIFIVLGIFSDGLYAILAGALGVWLKRSQTFWRIRRYFAGGIYLALGVATALYDARNE